MKKIIQITNSVTDRGDENFYALTEDGKVYYWGIKVNKEWSIDKQHNEDGTIKPRYLYGWIEKISDF